MRKIFVLTLMLCLAATFSYAQKYAVIDTRYIFDKMPEFKQVQKQVDAQAATWQKDIDTKQAVLDKLYSDYEAEETMMSEDLKKQKEDELFNKEKELRDLQKKRFGFEGDLFKKRQELMEPLQKKVADAVNKLSKANGYDLVFDKSEGKSIIFADPKLDKSEDVLRELRLK
ncbi:OmpH family outer membrane protein [Niabella ginsengisoli]|uniref:OmpH family outer membrane protein n=1 Tax=Niabella ginsengisoli TaxID=522298 RepID=A0ABS9SPU1_9BACT|nr:OmpH family outer membrane protein [Niabella ginsengisoli]MCH5600391.1 OmpH family outer membrane protein [Niabella ginsengisoli]